MRNVDAAESSGLVRIPGVVKVDRIHLAGAQRLGKIDKHGAGIALVLERVVAQENLVDVQRVAQVELDARAVLEHPEADRVLAAETLLVGIDANVQVVIEQVVVGAVRSVRAAQHVIARGDGRPRIVRPHARLLLSRGWRLAGLAWGLLGRCIDSF